MRTRRRGCRVSAKPAVGRYGDAGIATVEGGDLVIDVGGEDHDVPLLEPELEGADGEGRLQAAIDAIEIGISPRADVEEAQNPAFGVLRHAFSRPDAVHGGPGGERVV